MSISLSDMWRIKMFLDITNMYEAYELEKQEQEREQRKYENLELASNACAELGTFLLDVFAKINPNQIDRNVLNVIPYAFYQIGRKQGGTFNREQKRFLDIFYSVSTASITRYLLDEAIRGKESAVNQIEYAVGITKHRASAFWKNFYKVVLLSNGDETVYSQLITLFTKTVGTFGMLGKEKISMKIEHEICREFTDAIYTQVLESNNYIEDEIDSLGVTSVSEHYRRILDIARSIDQQQNSFENSAMLYLIALCYELINRSYADIGKKAELLNEAMLIAGVQFEENGYIIMKHFVDHDEAAKVFHRLLDEMQIAVINLADMTGSSDIPIEFNEECASFLIGIERELVKQYPEVGLGSYANDIMSKQIEIAMEYVR